MSYDLDYLLNTDKETLKNLPKPHKSNCLNLVDYRMPKEFSKYTNIHQLFKKYCDEYTKNKAGLDGTTLYDKILLRKDPLSNFNKRKTWIHTWQSNPFALQTKIEIRTSLRHGVDSIFLETAMLVYPNKKIWLDLVALQITEFDAINWDNMNYLFTLYGNSLTHRLQYKDNNSKNHSLFSRIFSRVALFNSDPRVFFLLFDHLHKFLESDTLAKPIETAFYYNPTLYDFMLEQIPKMPQSKNSQILPDAFYKTTKNLKVKFLDMDLDIEKNKNFIKVRYANIKNLHEKKCLLAIPGNQESKILCEIANMLYTMSSSL